MSDESREFTNEYPDYTSGMSPLSFDPDHNNQLKADWIAKLWENINHQLIRLERGLETQVDFRDTSVYTGTPGISLLYLHLADADSKEKMSGHLAKALSYVEPSFGHLMGRRFTFLCGDPGPLAIGAVIYHRLGRQVESQELLKRLVSLHKKVVDLQSPLPDEYLYGRAGYLYALTFVKNHIADDCVDPSIINSVISAIIQSGLRLSKQEKWKCPLMYKWHDSYYLGAAHGVSGILYLLLRVAKQLSSQELNDYVRGTITFLQSLRYPSGNYPSSIDSKSDRLIHWCHGAPGFVHMFVWAFKVFNDETYLAEALACGDVIWKRGLLKKGYGICHGASGNAYAFLALFQLTGDPKHLYRATKFTEWCFDMEIRKCRMPDRPLSLFEGLAGTIYFMVSMFQPASALFPAF